jgi:hypothetical protein
VKKLLSLFVSAGILVGITGCPDSKTTPKDKPSVPADKTEPKKTEPAKTEPKKTEPAKTEPAKTEPKKTEKEKKD